MTPTELAREIFDGYAGMDAPDLPAHPTSAWQVKHARWADRNFGATPLEQIVLGMAEELGELSHAVLKRAQGIRGMDDEAKFREAAGDAIADVLIYATHACTALRLDFATLYMGTMRKVLERDWKADPVGAGDGTQPAPRPPLAERLRELVAKCRQMGNYKCMVNDLEALLEEGEE